MSNEQTKFNLQTYLRDMHGDIKADLQALGQKVDSVKETTAQHEVRIVVVENHRKAVRWLSALLVTAIITALIARAFKL